MSHTIHPDIHEHGLANGCGRCDEIAARPLAELDTESLRDLIARTLANRFPGGVFGPYAEARSETEAVAMAQVMTALERTGKLFELAPDLAARYLSDRWGIEVGLAGSWA